MASPAVRDARPAGQKMHALSAAQLNQQLTLIGMLCICLLGVTIAMCPQRKIFLSLRLPGRPEYVACGLPASGVPTCSSSSLGHRRHCTCSSGLAWSRHAHRLYAACVHSACSSRAAYHLVGQRSVCTQSYRLRMQPGLSLLFPTAPRVGSMHT